MSARSVFEAEYGITGEYDQELLEAVLAEHAHKLAEKIRQEIRTLRADGVLEPDKDWAASDAADLIDPEVEDA